MPTYTYRCEDCGRSEEQRRSFAEGPTSCACSCGGRLEHDFAADIATVELDTSACRDHNVIERSKRVYRPGTRANADRVEAAHAKHVRERRQQLKEGGNRGRIKQSHAIPADLYHGKLRETKDRTYWQDPKNVARHNAFRVDGG